MAEEMMLENFPFESDEAEDWESDESFAESDESAEDIGERTRQRGRRRGQYARGVRGVRGMTVRGPEGPRNLQFPAKLATAAETVIKGITDVLPAVMESRFMGTK